MNEKWQSLCRKGDENQSNIKNGIVTKNIHFADEIIIFHGSNGGYNNKNININNENVDYDISTILQLNKETKDESESKSGLLFSLFFSITLFFQSFLLSLNYKFIDEF